MNRWLQAFRTAVSLLVLVFLLIIFTAQQRQIGALQGFAQGYVKGLTDCVAAQRY